MEAVDPGELRDAITAYIERREIDLARLSIMIGDVSPREPGGISPTKLAAFMNGGALSDKEATAVYSFVTAKSIDERERARIRAALVAHMKEHGRGVPWLQKQMAEYLKIDRWGVSLITLQRFLRNTKQASGKRIRTGDLTVAMYSRFVGGGIDTPEDQIGRGLVAMYQGSPMLEGEYEIKFTDDQRHKITLTQKAEGYFTARCADLHTGAFIKTQYGLIGLMRSAKNYRPRHYLFWVRDGVVLEFKPFVRSHEARISRADD